MKDQFLEFLIAYFPGVMAQVTDPRFWEDMKRMVQELWDMLIAERSSMVEDDDDYTSHFWPIEALIRILNAIVPQVWWRPEDTTVVA